jgi:hypothetical protein
MYGRQTDGYAADDHYDSGCSGSGGASHGHRACHIDGTRASVQWRGATNSRSRPQDCRRSAAHEAGGAADAPWRHSGTELVPWSPQRTRTGWTAWKAPDACHGGPDGAIASNRALLVAPGITEYEVVLSGEGATGTVTELNTVDGPLQSIAGEPLASMPLPDWHRLPGHLPSSGGLGRG